MTRSEARERRKRADKTVADIMECVEKTIYEEGYTELHEIETTIEDASGRMEIRITLHEPW